MRDSRQLSRLEITDHVCSCTPMCVLVEIADAHGIKYEQKDYEKPDFTHHLLISIRQTVTPSITVDEIKDKNQWQFIARFVNKHTQWTQSKLKQAYNFLIEFMTSEDPLPKIPTGFLAGLQTPDNPLYVNACVLYKVCTYHDLNLNCRTTIDQMANAVRMLKEDMGSVIRRVKVFIDRDARRADLINVLMLSHHEIKDPDPVIIDKTPTYDILPQVDTSHDLLRLIHSSLNDITILKQRIDPTTDCGAIALSAINFNIDISKSSIPLSEYKMLKITGGDDYRPVDPWLNYWYDRNPAMFDLTITFNPLFPAIFYDNNRMPNMVRNEGFTAAQISEGDPYELLQLAYVSETFYQGEMPNMKYQETPINLDEVKDVPYGELLCYGQLDVPLRPISMDELASMFDNNQNFSSPFDPDDVFSPTSINKLKLIAQSSVGPNPNINLTSDTLQVRARLSESICRVDSMIHSTDGQSRQLSLLYKHADIDTKRTIITTLNYLLHLGMFMRGWMGVGEYPIVKAPVPPDQQLQVAVNVTNTIAKYESSCRSLGKIGTQINNLPLVIYRDNEYQASNCSDYGLTIGERITIVKQGDQCRNINSCIRLSSNWICASAHKYLTAIGLSPPFDIFHLRHIS